MPEISETTKKIEYKTSIAIIVVILSMTFAIRSSNNMYTTSVPLLARYYFFFSNVEIGLLASLASLAIFIMSTFINAKAKPKSRREIFIASSIIYAVTFPFFYISTSLTIWLILPVASFTLGSIMPNIITSASLFKDKKQRERILSIYTLTLSLSLILGPYIESQLLLHVSLAESFLIFSILPAIGMVDSFFIKFPDEMGVKKTGLDTSVLKDRGFQSTLLA